jgi:hypothetical protein
MTLIVVIEVSEKPVSTISLEDGGTGFLRETLITIFLRRK